MKMVKGRRGINLQYVRAVPCMLNETISEAVLKSKENLPHTMSLQRAQEIPRFNLKCLTLSDRVVVSAKVKQDWPCGLALQTLIGITLTESKHRKSIKEANSEVTSVILWGKNNSQPCLYNQTVLKASIFIIHFPCWHFLLCGLHFLLLQRFIWLRLYFEFLCYFSVLLLLPWRRAAS